MAIVNRTKKEINAKLVYYGPALSGKRTSLEYIYKKLKPECRGKMKSVATQNDRMLFFDFMPAELANVNGYSFRFHIYTISGDVSQLAIWKMVLKGVDGIVFVADSATDRMAANAESMKTLSENLSIYGKSLADFPSVIQCNKQDLPGATSVAEMKRSLGVGDVPLVAAKGKKGEGVVASLNKVIKGIIENLKETESALQLDAKEKPVAMPVPPPVTPSAKGARPGVKGDSFDELATYTLAQAAEAAPALEELEPIPSAPPVNLSEPTIEVAGEVEVVGDGKFRLPLAVIYGGKKKMFAVKLNLSVEELLR